MVRWVIRSILDGPIKLFILKASVVQLVYSYYMYCTNSKMELEE